MFKAHDFCGFTAFLVDVRKDVTQMMKKPCSTEKECKYFDLAELLIKMFDSGDLKADNGCTLAGLLRNYIVGRKSSFRVENSEIHVKIIEASSNIVKYMKIDY